MDSVDVARVELRVVSDADAGLNPTIYSAAEDPSGCCDLEPTTHTDQK